ncbi:cytochrome P450 [Streptomyces rochei]|uniref:cytochrome P450 n=1 Tax=Streptomyces rochei TaxID=1928 RepID=UPI0036387167
MCEHRETDGEPLHPHTAAVELLNVLRPTVAVCWFVAYTAHALHLQSGQRERLRGGGAAYAAAFVHEVRRFYPFVPFLGGLTVRDLAWRGVSLSAGGMVLLDVFGQNHDEKLWGYPFVFRPERFLQHAVEHDELVPQGGGEPRTGHRCPGEGLTIGLLEALALRLADLDYAVPDQDLRISLRRIPARVRSGCAVQDVRTTSERTPTPVYAGPSAAYRRPRPTRPSVAVLSRQATETRRLGADGADTSGGRGDARPPLRTAARGPCRFLVPPAAGGSPP